MKSASYTFSGFLFCLIIAQFLARAQERTQRPRDGGMRGVLISIFISSIPNALFTATVNTESVQQLADGNSITLKNHRAIARDEDGRIFQKRRVLVPEDSKHESVVTQIEISDPVTHRLTICIPREQVCQVEEFEAPEFVPPPAAAAKHMQPGAPRLEDLGKQLVEGLETVGTRETTVIETGAIGNNSPIEIRREYWYSPKLGINLISRLQDPRIGTQDFELSEVTLRSLLATCSSVLLTSRSSKSLVVTQLPNSAIAGEGIPEGIGKLAFHSCCFTSGGLSGSGKAGNLPVESPPTRQSGKILLFSVENKAVRFENPASKRKRDGEAGILPSCEAVTEPRISGIDENADH